MRMERNTPPRPRKHSLLIQCEGQKTEPNYLEEFCQRCGVGQRLTVQVKRGKGQNAVMTVEAAIAEGTRKKQGVNVYDEIWCVLDVEHIGHEAKLNEAIVLAQDYKTRLYLSNPSFEVWLIAHFERATRDFTNGDAAEAYLSTHWRRHLKSDYDKGDPNLYRKLADRVLTAVDNAQWILETFHENAPCRSTNSSTEVYQLVHELLAF